MSTRNRRSARTTKPARKSRAKKSAPLVAPPPSVAITDDRAWPTTPAAAHDGAAHHLPSAPEILVAAADLIESKAAARDKPSGERSMARTVAAFGALTGHQLSESEGWMFLAAVKLARATAGSHEADDYTDLAAYAGLAGEAAARTAATPAG